jgi:cell wall-associated NlpC family hydrolase
MTVRFEKKFMPFSFEAFRQYFVPFCFILSLPAITLFATSCTTHTGLSSADSFETESPGKANGYFDSHEIEKRIRGEYMRWKGTQHSLGGTDRGGIDCSAFVKALYLNVFNIQLPRTTQEQVKEGTSINRDELRAGDLVFFKPPDFPCHVGIFLSGKEFVHASKSKGVIISQIDSSYWGKYYWTERRIFSE